MNNFNYIAGVKKQSTSFVCPLCQGTFATESNFKRHIYGVHVKSRLKCFHCDKSFTQKDNLKRHIVGVHNGLSFVCDFCDFITTRKDSLKRHNKQKHRNGSTSESWMKNIRCTLLNRTRNNLKQQMGTDVKMNMFNDYCITCIV